MTTAFSIEHHDDKFQIVSRARGTATKLVVYTGFTAKEDPEVTMLACRMAYNLGRRDEASIRAAALRGLGEGTPFGVAS